eukprot:CAMPEP_0118675736 /NCGR_PEP_ID=MMETSP0800-20121206/1624_1 /TAXON_ID=210618 ORGANISM="Striatella unipunctata, Strain CCMP2910" /NCGR_SAMPLE_ID=MMETSP0800 /ASSEMBLY_ACC=CAM_ASM_000638 /LENGTH=534 /DNA_ID=CAMNT_0006571105 /DNA_START=158 /DNA_END=1762 /DNA_ORIENTATION=+
MTEENEIWTPENEAHVKDARENLHVWPLDEHNSKLLNFVHTRASPDPETPHEEYDLLVIGSGAGGLVSSKQAARRGAKSCMISEHLAGGDCLNVGCVPSKALLRCAKAMKEIKRAADFGISLGGGEVSLDFDFVMQRLRRLRAVIAPADGHPGTQQAGTHVFQGRGVFTSANTVRVTSADGKTTDLKFKKAVIATGGRPTVPNVPGLAEAPYTTNEVLFNLQSLPPRMLVLGAGVIALEMAQSFAAFGSKVTVLKRSRLLSSLDEEGGETMEEILTRDGVNILAMTPEKIVTIKEADPEDPKSFPLMEVHLKSKDSDEITILETECLLVATGRAPNVQNLGLDLVNVEYSDKDGIKLDEFGRSVTNPDIYSVGDCAAGLPRLTHVSGEMAKLVVENSLFGGEWKLSSFVVPAVMYTEPEFATVGLSGSKAVQRSGLEVDEYKATFQHNDRAILEEEQDGFVKILCKKGTDEIVGATIISPRAGEMINEVSLAMKNGIGLKGIGRNIHPYPSMGEGVMGPGVQYINSHWKTMKDM